jgi:hypothetical protein
MDSLRPSRTMNSIFSRGGFSLKAALLLSVLMLFLISVLAPSAFALGPKIVGASKAVWDPNTETNLSGYYFYWRTVGGAFADTSRISVGVSVAPEVDLTKILWPANGKYEIAVTAYDTAGNESGLSNIVPFDVSLPAAPANLRKK